MTEYAKYFNTFTKILQSGLDVDTPHFLTMGCQDSAKSTTTNRLFGWSLAPVRTTVEEKASAKTRVPLLLEFKQTENTSAFVNLRHNGIDNISHFQDINVMCDHVKSLNKQLENNSSFALDSYINVRVEYPTCDINLIGWDLPGINYSDNYDKLSNNYRNHLKAHSSAIVLLIVDKDPEIVEGYKILRDCGISSNNVIICFTKADLPDRKAIYPVLISKYSNINFNICVIKNPDLTNNQNIDYKRFGEEEKEFFETTPEYANVKTFCGISRLKHMIATLMNISFKTSAQKVLENLKTKHNVYSEKFQKLRPKIETNDDKYNACVYFCQNIKLELLPYFNNQSHENTNRDPQISFNEAKRKIHDYITIHINQNYTYLSSGCIASIINKILTNYVNNDYKTICDFVNSFGTTNNAYHNNECINAVRKFAVANEIKKYQNFILANISNLHMISNEFEENEKNKMERSSLLSSMRQISSFITDLTNL